jgi:hypothetical protein
MTGSRQQTADRADSRQQLAFRTATFGGGANTPLVLTVTLRAIHTHTHTHTHTQYVQADTCYVQHYIIQGEPELL